MHIGWPQGIYLVLNMLALVVIAGVPPEERKPPNPFSMIGMWLCVTLPLLYWGGFFG